MHWNCTSVKMKLPAKPSQQAAACAPMRLNWRDFARSTRACLADPVFDKDEIEVFIGLDGGSTSTKAVALSPAGEILASSYRLSHADPITDAVGVLNDLRSKLELSGIATRRFLAWGPPAIPRTS